MNRIQQLFEKRNKNILNVFCTAGYPKLNDLVPIVESLEKSGADIVEIGIPYSDPSADGPTIQYSNGVALKNGMSLKLLLDQLKDIRATVSIPLIFMGDINPILQMGMEAFLQACQTIGIDGVIIPNLPLREYEEMYKPLFERYEQSNIFLITPQTSEERIRKIDRLTNSFIYVVSTYAITGGQLAVDDQADYFNRIKSMNLNNPALIGFGIGDHTSFQAACQYLNGAIIGSAFIKALDGSNDVKVTTEKFVKSIIN
ncbi:MAG: tryptophan synthase subunit alpha [Chitinophagales bacterium]